MSEKIYIKHDTGTRFTATSRGLTLVSGKGDPEDGGPDGMSPGELFATSLGLCMGVTLLAYCKNHGLSCESITLEMERESTEDGRRLKGLKLKAQLPYELSEKNTQILHRVAHRCYVHQSIANGFDVDISISGTVFDD